MANTVVAIFENKDAAEQAQQHLISSGYGGYHIELKIASYKAEAQFPVSEAEEKDVLDKITAFFKDLFGSDHEAVDHYSQASRTGIILTVHTDTRSEAEKVSEVLDAYGMKPAAASAEENPELHTAHSLVDHTGNLTPPALENSSDQTYQARAVRIKSRIVERNVEKSKAGDEQNGETFM